MVVLILCVACRDDGVGPQDAGPGSRNPDGLQGLDAALKAPALSMTANGCAANDAGALICIGPAPLSLVFAPLTAGSLDKFLWTFGDDSQSMETAPAHTFTLPGRYSVSLAAQGISGSIAITRPDMVVVTPNRPGRSCDVNAQCADGLQCVCGAAGMCNSAFFRGICTSSCRDAPCAAGAVCADLSRSGAAGDDTPWRRPLCIASCEGDRDCAAGLACRWLPGRYPVTQWVKGCFVQIPGPVGAPCRSATGDRESTQCVTGLCADWGAHGVCTHDCENNTCPQGTACASGPEGKRCMALCSEAAPCTNDSLLSCQPSGNAGFKVPDGANEDRFCMPNGCAIDKDCSPLGRCLVSPGATNGHCVRGP